MFFSVFTTAMEICFSSCFGVIKLKEFPPLLSGNPLFSMQLLYVFVAKVRLIFDCAKFFVPFRFTPLSARQSKAEKSIPAASNASCGSYPREMANLAVFIRAVLGSSSFSWHAFWRMVSASASR